MSYARFGDDSDVYVYLDVAGELRCCACRFLTGCESRGFRTTADLIAHLYAHQDAGHAVPADTFTELEARREENDAWIAAGAPDDDPLDPKLDKAMRGDR